MRVLVDEDRLEKYKKSPKVFNGKPLNFNYILPNATDYKADLIIIATKFDGLCDAIKNIENFVKEDTIILSLLNGVSSEELIAKKYGWKHIPISYFIGHSAMRDGNKEEFKKQIRAALLSIDIEEYSDDCFSRISIAF